MGSVEYWWIRTPTGEEFGPIATVGIQRLINENYITTSDEIREENSNRYQKFINCSFFSFTAEQMDKEKTEVEKTEVLKSEVGKTIHLRKSVEISAAKPQKREIDIVERPLFFSDIYSESKVWKRTVFVLNIALYMVLVIFIVEKYTVKNGVSFNQPSKSLKPGSQFSASKHKKMSRKVSSVTQ